MDIGQCIDTFGTTILLNFLLVTQNLTYNTTLHQMVLLRKIKKL